MIHISMFLLMVLMFIVPAHAFPPAPIPQTGQTTCWDTSGAVIACTGTGQDGDKQNGVVWPSPRFTDNANGTITDNLTGLVWLKNANCTETVASVSKSSGTLNWDNAMVWSKGLASGSCGLTDGSTAGQWRLPSRPELESLLNDQPPSTWLNGQGFNSVQYGSYWSGSTCVYGTRGVWDVGMDSGSVYYNNKTISSFVWPVRSGQ